MPGYRSEYDQLLDELAAADARRRAAQAQPRGAALVKSWEAQIAFNRRRQTTLMQDLRVADHALRAKLGEAPPISAADLRDGRRARVRSVMAKAMALFQTGELTGHEVRTLESRALAMMAQL